ncbi:MAG: hypothetical protein ACODTL_06495 [Brucella sp.]
MQTLLKIETKNLQQAQLGELIRVRAGGSYSYAIVLHDREHLIVGFLNKEEPEAEGLQSYYSPYPHANPVVASYGTDWVVRPNISQDEELGRALNADLHSPLFHIEKQRTAISFKARPGTGEETIYFDTTTWQPGFLDPAFTISVRNWDIWASKEEADRNPDNPLIRIRA